MTGSDFELGGDVTNPTVESESFIYRSSLEKKVDSASIHVISPTDNSTVVQDVESVGGSVVEDSMDSVSAEGNISVVNNRRAVDSSELSDVASHDDRIISDRNHGSVKNLKSGQRKTDKLLKESGSFVYDSMPSMFDDFAANGGGAMVVRSSVDAFPGHKFEVGDMVWGKVKSHPWWPGHVYSEEFATPAVLRSKRDGLLLVAFFGDSSYGWFDCSELIPFDSNFAEKSRQTNSKTFVKAVEEAIDEVSRRSALGLSCMCRSKQNFRETHVQGYFAVDVPDYEPGEVYSIDAIKKARDGFQPRLALDYIRQLALEPSGSEHADIDFIKNKANAIAYRRAIYEEFDETYAQAFGYQSAHTSGSVQDLPPGRTQSKAPLSGRQVFADTSGKGKSSTKPIKPKDHPKKDKYLFKRRDDPKDHQKENPKIPFSPQLDHVEDSMAGEYVLQKRVSAKVDFDSKDATRTALNLEGTPTVLELSESTRTGVDEKKIVKQMEDRKVFSQNDGPQKIITSQRTDNGPKKVKVVKRPIGEMDSGKSSLLEKKKKRKIESDGTHIIRKDGIPIKKPIQSSLTSKPSIEDHRGNPEAEIPRILGDLHSLALDPFLAINRGLAAKAQKVFLRFRSVVFQKSLSSSLMEDDGTDDHSIKTKTRPVIPAARGPENGVKPPPPPVSAARPDDPTRIGRKRGPSDRQEEMVEKKKKKIGDIRNLTEKKVVKRIEEPPARDVKPPIGMPPRKPELKNPEKRIPGPTMLIMKFPTGGSLPSINELKARFARYGPMDHSATRIFWNTFTCRVVYRNKAHALAAYKFVTGSSGLFGNSDIKCSLKEFGVVGSSDSEPPPVKASKEEMEDRPPLIPATPGGQLKSILKKSGGDEAAGNGGGRGVPLPRVKFMLGGDESHKNNTNASIDFNSKIGSSTTVSSSTTQFTRPPPPLLPLPLPPQPPQNYMNYGAAVAPPLPLVPLQRPGNFVHNVQRPVIGPPKPDISQEMLRLMRKCNEVVTNITNVLGYVPYHPL